MVKKKKCTSAPVAQEFQSEGLLFEVMVGVADKVENNKEQRNKVLVGVLKRSSSCPRVSYCPRNLTFEEFSLAKSVVKLVVMSFFHSGLKVFH
jgi:hypothetical protein